MARYKIWQFFALVSYTIVMAGVLVLGQAPLLGIAFVQFVAPMLVLWQRLDLRSRLLPGLALGSLLVFSVIQMYAYAHGLWYEISTLDIRLLGIPLESLVYSTIFVWYMVVLYEYFFDDGVNRIRTEALARGYAGLAVIAALLIGYIYLTPAPFVESPFLLLVGVLLLCLVVVLARLPTRRLLLVVRKAILFTITVFPLSLVTEFVLLETNARFFANLPEYIGVLDYVDHVLPYEALALLLVLPLWLVIMYELYFDDGR